MIPEIIFKYSSKHDSFWKNYLEIHYEVHGKEKTKEILNNYPSRDKINKKIEEVEKSWKEQEKDILERIEETIGLKWQEPIIKVYVVGQCIPYSDPLTMPAMETSKFNTTDDFIDLLVHELIHQIQSQNHEIFMKWINYLYENYSEEKRDTQSHILLYAVHKKLYEDFFGEERLQRDLSRSKRKEKKRRAWDIVENEGHEEIIRKFKEIINE